MINWHRRIEEEHLPGFLGMLTVHFPDQFLLEGLAESLAFVLPSRGQQLESSSLMLRELHRYYLLVMNNAHIKANEGNGEDAAKYALERLPFTNRNVVEKEIRDRSQNPLFRSYQYVYGIAKESFLAAFAQLSFEQKWSLLSVVYERSMTADQFLQVAGSLSLKNAQAGDRGLAIDLARLLNDRWNSSN